MCIRDRYGEKAIDLTICCPDGSKAQLYARKYGCNCCEIPKSLTANKEICASGLWVKFVLLKEKIDLNVLCKKLSINKGETWSWETSSSSVEINKVMSMDEAEKMCIRDRSTYGVPLTIFCVIILVGLLVESFLKYRKEQQK